MNDQFCTFNADDTFPSTETSSVQRSDMRMFAQGQMIPLSTLLGPLPSKSHEERDGGYLRPSLFFTEQEAESVDWDAVIREW
jgi:hypothetical protein